MRIIHTGRIKTKQERINLPNALKGRKMSETHREKLSKNHKMNTDEGKEMYKTQLFKKYGVDNVSKIMKKCTYCNNTFGALSYGRWHGNKCKKKPLNIDN